MKIGIIYCGFNTEEYVLDTIAPWIKAKGRHDLSIAAVSIPFQEYFFLNQGEDNTTQILRDLNKEGKIDFLFTEPKYVKENVARNLGLFSLLNNKPDIIMLVDSDEFYTQESIDKIFQYVKDTPEHVCYEIHLKNYIFDGKTWLDGFHPPRIFRTDRHKGINQFYWDNDLLFNDSTTHKGVSSITIPKEVAHIKHMTWLNNEKSKLKTQYHLKHFGACSYRWNNETDSLELDLEYYDKHNYPRPVVHKE